MIESGSTTPKYFSYDYGNIHFIAFTFEDFLDLDNNPDFGKQVCKFFSSKNFIDN